MDNISIEELIKALKEATEVQLEKNEISKKTVEQEEKDLQKAVERSAGYTRVNGKLVSIEQQRIEVEAKLNKELEAQFGASKKLASKQEAAFNQQLRQLDYIIDSNGKLIKTTIELDAAQNKILKNLKKKEDYDAEMKKRQEKIGSDLKNGLSEIGKASWGVATKLAKGETSFTTLFPLMDAVGNAAASVSKGLLSMIPYIGGFLGSLSEAAIKTGLEVSKFAIEMLERSLKTFQELADAGALVADGMTGVNRQLVQSGMSLDGFKKVVKENGRTLAAWGGTVGEGAEIFSKAVGELSLTKVGDDLRRLGLNADAMGESAAAFLEQEIRLGRGRNMTGKQLTEGTVQYIKELDLLQKVTGLSRQDAQKQRDELLSDSRYRASIEGLSKDTQNGLNALMLTFKDPNFKRGLMDLTSGVVGTNDAGMVVNAFGDTAAEAIQSLKDAKAGDLPKVYDKIMLDFQAAAKNNKEMMGEVYKYVEPGTFINSATIFEVANGTYVKSMKDAVKTQQAQLKAEDKLTEQTILAQKEMDKLANSALAAANALMPNAADAVLKFTESLNKAIAKVKEILGAPSAQNVPDVDKAIANTQTAEQRQAEAEERAKNTTPGTQAHKEANEDVEQARARAEKARKIEDTAKTKKALEAIKKQGFGAPPPPPPESSTEPTKSTADVLKLIKFQGDSLGNKEHFDMLTGNTQDMFMEMIAKYNKPVTITSAARSKEEQLELWQRTVRNGTPGFLPNGNPVAEPGTSKHEVGKALDLARGDVEALDQAGLLKLYGFKRLANDPPHIEMARFGAEFDGPQSGYPVMMHGPEIAIPKPEFDALKQSMSEVSKSSLAGAMPAPISHSGGADSVAVLKSLHGIMTDKFDQMINVMERSTDIQARLLNNSMV